MPAVRELTEKFTLRALYQSGQLEGDADQKAQSEPLDRVAIWQGDITKLEIDAVVNAAKTSLLGGGGIDGASVSLMEHQNPSQASYRIHRAAGPNLLEACRALNGCDTGSAKMTKAFDLPAKYIIHTVGPVYSSRRKDECRTLLKSCYTTCLRLCVENKIKSLAFNCISTGVYGYPQEDAAHVALEAVSDFLQSPDADKIDLIIFCIFLGSDLDIYSNIAPTYFPPVVEANITPAPEAAA